MEMAMLNLINKGTLKCVSCKHFLREPVKYVVNLGDICGPCYEEKHLKNKWSGYDNKAANGFLSIIESLTVACKYKDNGCEILLKLHDKDIHEESCEYVGRLCPFLNSCEWHDSITKFCDHFYESHRNDVIDILDEENFKINLNINNDKQVIKLLSTGTNRCFLRIEIDLDQQKLYYTLCDCDIIRLPKQELVEIPYSMKFMEENSIQCILIEEHLKMLPALFSNLLESHVDFSTLMINASGKLNIKIDIQRFSHLNHLKCNVCFLYLRPPIYLCTSGHSICSICFDTVKKCQECNSLYGRKGRNRIIEKLMRNVKFRCIHNGCQRRDFSEKISKHELDCTHKQIKCPVVDCNFSGNNENLIEHFSGQHSNILWKTDVNDEYVSAPFEVNGALNNSQNNERKIYTGFLLKYNRLFGFIQFADEGTLHFRLELIGHPSVNSISIIKQFSYEIKIYRLNKLQGWCFNSRKHCLPDAQNLEFLKRFGMSIPKTELCKNKYSRESIKFHLKLIKLPIENEI